MPSAIRIIVYLLLLLQVLSALWALNTEDFLFKSGSAGIGALVILILSSRKRFAAPDLWMVVAAFLLSIVGDYFLSNRNGEIMMFVYGILFFFLAHVGYLAYSLFNGRISWPFTLLLCAGYLIFFFTSLYANIGDPILMWAALAYLFVSCFSLGAAWGLRQKGWLKWGYVAGIGLVLFSDTLIAFREFMDYDRWDFLILPTYYLAHIFITWALFDPFRTTAEAERI
ncbi:MAG: lysoplasmalogenase [Robiginitalea sp.]